MTFTPTELSGLDYGITANGTTDDTAALDSFVAACKSTGKPGRLPSGTIITSHGLKVFAGATFHGGGRRGKTVVKVKNGSNANACYGETTAANWASAPSVGDDRFLLENITFDGNRANNSAGSGLYLYGCAYTLNGISFVNCAEDGMRTKFSDTGALYGMEATFNDVTIDSVGQHGWRFLGVHDSHVANVRIIDASLSSDGGFCGLYVDTGGNGRFFNLHVWQRGSTTPKPAFAASSPGSCDFTLCHFEGTRRLFDHRGNDDSLVACRFYAMAPAYGGAPMVLIEGNTNKHAACFYDANGADIFAVQFGAGSAVSGNMIDGKFGGFDKRTPFNYANTGGYNTVYGRGYCNSGGVTTFGGTMNPTDELNYRQSGTVINVNI